MLSTIQGSQVITKDRGHQGLTYQLELTVFEHTEDRGKFFIDA